MSQNLQQNRDLVKSVFDNVYDKYDLMNDIMSLGAHRSWKKKLVNMMNPSINDSLIDVGCGTGDIGEIYSKATKNKSYILNVDPNRKMIEKGKERLKGYKNILWKIGSGEELDVDNETFNFYTISFGLRNTSNVEKTITEAYRVLKTGGRFLCLEFSKIENPNLEFIYNQYSKIIPKIGKYVVGTEKPYEYLIKTIKDFINQEELLEVMKSKKFVNCNYINLNGGVVAIHSGWKV